jgi:hypothetical protein
MDILGTSANVDVTTTSSMQPVLRRAKFTPKKSIDSQLRIKAHKKTVLSKLWKKKPHIYKAAKQGSIINEILFDQNNVLFELL